VTLAVCGVCGLIFNNVSFLWGMERTSVAHAALIIALTPVMVLLLAALRGQERITPRKLTGMGIAVCGIAVLNLSPGRAGRGASLLGDVFILLAALSFSIFTVGSKESARRHGAVTISSFGYASSAALCLPLLLWRAQGFDFGAVRAEGWAMLVYMAVFASVVCYLIFQYALEHMPASQVAAFSYVQPMIAAVAGWFALGEPVTQAVVAATALVLSGVWLASRTT
jgi:drug/metabolite transporter (DMT)-like permease